MKLTLQYVKVWPQCSLPTGAACPTHCDHVHELIGFTDGFSAVGAAGHLMMCVREGSSGEGPTISKTLERAGCRKHEMELERIYTNFHGPEPHLNMSSCAYIV